MCGGLLRVDSVDYSMPSISTVDGSFLRIKYLFSVAETRRLLSRALVVRWSLRVNKRRNRALSSLSLSERAQYGYGMSFL